MQYSAMCTPFCPLACGSQDHMTASVECHVHTACASPHLSSVHDHTDGMCPLLGHMASCFRLCELV